jgi:hypothetical protein
MNNMGGESRWDLMYCKNPHTGLDCGKNPISGLIAKKTPYRARLRKKPHIRLDCEKNPISGMK